MASDTITPAGSPPAGQTSNFINPDSVGTKFLVVNCVFLPLAVIALAVRTWTRLFVVRSFRSDDCEYRYFVFFYHYLSLVNSILQI